MIDNKFTLKNFNPPEMTEQELRDWIAYIKYDARPEVSKELFPTYNNKRWKLTKAMREYCELQIELLYAKLNDEKEKIHRIRTRQTAIYNQYFYFNEKLNFKNYLTKDLLFKELYLPLNKNNKKPLDK